MYIFGCSLILLVWAYLSIKNNQIMMESSISWIFGSLVAGKLFQKYIETQPTPKG
jgi:hypothetical protein